jgi:hypothetical protein
MIKNIRAGQNFSYISAYPPCSIPFFIFSRKSYENSFNSGEHKKKFDIPLCGTILGVKSKFLSVITIVVFCI